MLQDVEIFTVFQRLIMLRTPENVAVHSEETSLLLPLQRVSNKNT